MRRAAARRRAAVRRRRRRRGAGLCRQDRRRRCGARGAADRPAGPGRRPDRQPQRQPQHRRSERRDRRRAGGDLDARAELRGASDEFDELAVGLNDMLDRLERSIGGLRHAGDAIAHDLRSPLTRLRARLEAALIEVEAGRAIRRRPCPGAGGHRRRAAHLRRGAGHRPAAGRRRARPTRSRFDPGDLAADMAELYEPVCEETRP